MTRPDRRSLRGHARPPTAPAPRPGPWRRPEVLGLAWSAALAAAVFVVYRGVLANGFVPLDDPTYVTDNPLVRDRRFGELLRVAVSHHWHPLTMLSLAWNAGGSLSPRPFLLGNVLLHAANTVLVFWLAWLLSGRRAAVAVFTALLFALHPMHVGSVAWISERKDVLHAFFWIGAAIAYVLHVRRPRLGLLALAFTAFVMACLAKGAAVSFPLAMVAIDLWMRRPLLDRRAVLEKLPFLAVALMFGAIALDVQAGGTFHGLLRGTPGAAEVIRTEQLYGPAQRLLLPAAGAMMYVVSLFAPVGTAAFHPYPSPAEAAGPAWRLAPLALLALLALAAWDLRRTRILSFALAWFLATIVLVLQWIPVGMAITSDRYTYLPYIGLAFAWAMGIDRLTARARVAGQLLWGASFAFALALAPVTARQVATWHDGETLWTRVLEVHPRSGRAYGARGKIRLEQGRAAEAESDLRTALRLGDQNASTFAPYETQYLLVSLGILEMERGRPDSALALFDRGIAVDSTSVPAHMDRALAWIRLGRLRQALPDLDRALALSSGSPQVLVTRGVVHGRLGEYAAGAADLDRAIAAGAGAPDVYASRGMCRLGLGDRSGAAEDFRHTLRLAPGHAGAAAQLRGMGLSPDAGREGGGAGLPR